MIFWRLLWLRYVIWPIRERRNRRLFEIRRDVYLMGVSDGRQAVLNDLVQEFGV
jgi:hypothetical protein